MRCELKARLGEIGAGVVEVVGGVVADECEVFLGGRAADFAWEPGYEGAGWDARAFGYEGPGGNDAARADVGAVEDDRPHADQDVVFQGAAMDGGVVADGAAVADEDGVEVPHAVKDGAVLNVGAVADADGVYVAADDGVHPDGGVLAEDDVSENLGGGVDVAGGGNGRGEASEGAEHVASVGGVGQTSRSQEEVRVFAAIAGWDGQLRPETIDEPMAVKFGETTR
jgi:hypothetical protein